MTTNQELENRIRCLNEEREVIQTDLSTARKNNQNVSAIWEAYNRVEEKIDKAFEELKKSKGNTRLEEKVSYDNQTVISTGVVRRKDSKTLEIKKPAPGDKKQL